MSQIWDAVKNFIANGLDLFHAGLEPIFGVNAWGWTIVALTIVVRILLIPLAVKQFRSMRAMQALQPQVKAVQNKYKTDRSMMRSDPERYRKIQSKKNEELQALYRENEVNPAAGCLPLLAQGPIFFALYSVLRDENTLGGQLSNAPFYVFDSLGEVASDAGAAGIALIVMVAASMFISQKQMMGRNQAQQGDMAGTQQKVMLYAMPLMMGFFGFQLPIGVLLYWVTTNLWTMAQQAIIMREATEEAASGGGGPGGDGGSGSPSSGPSTGSAGNTRRPLAEDTSDGDEDEDKGSIWPLRRSSGGGDGSNGKGGKSSHLPSRPSRRN